MTESTLRSPNAESDAFDDAANMWTRTASKPAMRDRRPLARVAALLAALALPAFLAAPVSALERGTRAPEIGLRDRDGNNVQLSALRGKVVLVDFWASWCGPCREEMPVLQRFHQRFGPRGLVVVGVNIDREEVNMRRFLDRTQVGFRIVHDGQHRVADRYAPPRMPSSYLIDKRGVVRFVHAGFRASDAREMEREIEQLLAE
ncbi:MAG: TlpA family protein disulfide reductase [Sandaracinus sp.]|nr:TlpA family protein disulfide reductase [Sandaracinus sp.]MCB9625711.1 TlpA family protein disulfide reductase [Sandaracinus sp.]